MNQKNLHNIRRSFIRIKSKYLTRDMKFWNHLNFSLYSFPQLTNWMPNTLWSNLLVKKGWIGSATSSIAKASWLRKYNFPLLMQLNAKLAINRKNVMRNSFRVLHQSDILQINPYTKKYFLRFFSRKSKWNKKPMFTALDRNPNYNAIAINSFNRGFPLSFKNRSAKTNMKYLQVM